MFSSQSSNTIYAPGIRCLAKAADALRLAVRAIHIVIVQVMDRLDGAALNHLKPLCRALASNIVHWNAVKALLKSSAARRPPEDVYDTYDISQWDNARRCKFARVHGKEDFWGAMPITAGFAEDSLFGVTAGTAAEELERLVVGVLQPKLHGRALAEYEERLKVRVLKESAEGERRAWDRQDIINLHHRVQASAVGGLILGKSSSASQFPSCLRGRLLPFVRC